MRCFVFFVALVLQVATTAAFRPGRVASSRWSLRQAAGSSSSGSLIKPRWAGDDVLSQIVNALIGFKPLFSVMKLAARSTLIKTAETAGIPWRARAQQLLERQGELETLKSKIVGESGLTAYPSYYVKEFHAYEEGNLNWPAAVECESATMSMALRVWPTESLTAEEAQERLRSSFLKEVRRYLQDVAKLADPKAILDVGCSVGVSTFYMAREFRQAQRILGLDLSPQMLAVAQQRQTESSGAWAKDGLERVSWKHAAMEASGLKDGEFDLTCASFMFHELPQKESVDILREMHRVTRSGGVVAITDNNPRSPVIQGLPPVLFTLMKSTEPWSDEYYEFDVEAALASVGFESVQTVASDPRHRTILALKKK